MNSLAGDLVIDWAKMPTYNTIMAVAAGAGLIGLVRFGTQLRSSYEVVTEGWALHFGLTGFVLTATGLHMTLTWPLAAGGFPFDNIIFGETSLAFGVMLIAAAVFVWFRGSSVLASPAAVEHLCKVARPASIFAFGMGLGLIGIAVAGVRYELFAAPPQEPISGEFARWPLVEAIFMSGLIGIVGLGAILFPVALSSVRSRLWPVIGWLWAVAGLALMGFGAMNFFTHIGLIVNTMGYPAAH